MADGISNVNNSYFHMGELAYKYVELNHPILFTPSTPKQLENIKEIAIQIIEMYWLGFISSCKSCIPLFIETHVYKITYSPVQNTLFHNMVLLQLVKPKLQQGVKYIKQNMCDKNTGMTHHFSALNGQHVIRYIIPKVHLRTKCLTSLGNY